MRFTMHRFLRILASAASIAAPAGHAAAQEPATSAEAAARVRAAYFQQSFQPGMDDAKRFEARFPRSPEVRAWRIVNQSRIDVADALAAADSLRRAFPASHWGNFARAFALSWRSDSIARAVPIAQRLLRARPADPDVQWLRGFTLHRDTQFTKVVQFVDSLRRARGQVTAEILVLKGNALASLYTRPGGDSTTRRRALETFAEARRLEPSNLNAHFLPGANLSEGSGDTAALGLLEHAVRLAPMSANVSSRYWTAVNGMASMPPDEKRRRITSTVDTMLALAGRHPSLLVLAATGYGEAKLPEQAAEVRARILRDHAGTELEERVVHDEILALGDSIFREEVSDTALARARHRQAVAEFVRRPRHIDKNRLGNMLLRHVQSVEQDSTVRGDSVTALVRRLVEYNPWNPTSTHYDAPLLIADRGGDIAYARRLVLQGDTIRRRELEQRKARFESVAEYANAADYHKAITHDALGWLAFREGNVDLAQNELAAARELQKQNPSIIYHLGQLAEHQGRTADARLLYAAGVTRENRWTGRKNREALTRLYMAEHGSLQGFDAYLEQLKADERAERRKKVLAERLTAGDTLPHFNLAVYDGNGARITQQGTRGKVTVINFWGIWCGPCIAEIPQIQQLHDSLKADSSVVFLTVDYNDDLQTLREFMEKRKLDFPVLLDEKGWVTNTARINAYPTTWFFDHTGRLAFRNVGASDNVLEEFLWRVQALKGETQRGAVATP